MIPVRTKSGLLLDLANPKPEMISVEDISWGLANQCRFIGQMEYFYSLAQHGMLVASLVSPRIQFKGLNHDNTEAYMGDVSRFLKHSAFMKGYRILEAELSDVIDQALGIEPLDDLDAMELHAADDLAAVFEHVVLRLRQPFRPDVDLPWAIQTGFITRTSLYNMRALLPRLWDHRTTGAQTYMLYPMSPRVARSLWMEEFRHQDLLRRTP